jgi:Flp pilus assembly protein TadG
MKHTKSERGQSLVELAISLVVLLFLLSGIVEFGLAFFQFVQLRDAAQEGALFGSTDPADFGAIETRVRASSNTPIKLDAAANLVTVEIYVDDVLVWVNGTDQGVSTTNTACEAHALKVRTEFAHEIFMPFMPQLLNRSEILLNAEVTDTILRPVCP